MKLNKNGHSGVTFLENYNIYRAGVIAWFPPKICAGLIAAGKAEAYDPNKKKGEKAADDNEAEITDLAVGLADGTLLIPSNWREVNHNKIIGWAKKIKPEAETLNKAEAIEIIAEAVKDQEEA